MNYRLGHMMNIEVSDNDYGWCRDASLWVSYCCSGAISPVSVQHGLWEFMRVQSTVMSLLMLKQSV